MGVSAPPTGDPKLVDWLKNAEASEEAITLFVQEELTYEDVMNLMTRQDIQRLGLKLGQEIRLWHAIQKERSTSNK